MNEQQLYRRLIRRSRHRSRSFAVIVALVVTVIVLVYAGVEVVLAALGRPALLVSPADVIQQIEHPATPAIIAGVVALVLAIILLVIAFGSGLRARHELPDERMAVVIDDRVLAGAISKVVRAEAKVPAERVSTSVSRRRAIVRVTPTSGMPLDAAVLTTAAGIVVSSLDPRPALHTTVSVSEHAVVGS